MSPDRIDAVLEVLAGLLDVALTEPALAPSRELLLGHAQTAREVARGRSAAVLGALDGFLLQLGEGKVAELAKTLRNLALGRTKSDGIGAYLEGVLAVARQALIGDSELLAALLEHIEKSEWQDFMATLPALRRAMTRLSPRETEAVAETAYRMLGVSKAEAADLLGAAPEIVAALQDHERRYEEFERSWGGDR
jgi:hypothetical protein